MNILKSTRSSGFFLLSTLISMNAFGSFQLDKSLFKGLSFVEETFKKTSMESVIKDHLGSEPLDDGKIEVLGKVVDKYSTTTKAQYYYKGIQVIGAMSFSHQKGMSIRSEHSITPLRMDVTPKLSPNDAYLIAREFAPENAVRVKPTLKILPNLERTNAQLIYLVDFESKSMMPGSDVYIDANNGKVIAVISHLESIAPINVYNTTGKKRVFVQDLVGNGGFGLPKKSGCLVVDADTNDQTTVKTSCDAFIKKADKTNTYCQILDGSSINPSDIHAFPVDVIPAGCNQHYINGVKNGTTDVYSDNAFSNASKVAQYYLDTHGRNGFDDKGSPITSFVSAGYRMNNAFWDGENNEMVYGSGDGVMMNNLTTSVDVSGHEMTHGVVQYTAALLMMDENGALNEAFADFFGKMIENKNSWKIGQGILVKDPSAGLRDLADPHSTQTTIGFDAKTGKPIKGPAPAHMKEKIVDTTSSTCGQNNDRCFVHGNSTIPSHAMYLMVQKMGKDKAEKVAYQTLTKMMTPRSNFADVSAAMKKACRNLYDESTCAKGTDAAWSEVGL